MRQADRSAMSATEFLQWTAELTEETRYELVDGTPVAMAPERNRHNLVKVDCCFALRQAMRQAGLGCTVFGDGATVQVDESNVYEPDVTVQCEGSVELDETTVAHPMILVEVLSSSTRSVDSSDKFIGYFQLPSVKHYLVVDPLRYVVIHHYRTRDGIGTALLRDGSLTLNPPGFSVSIADFFMTLRENS